MPKLTLMQGLPASGKSTRAALMAAADGNAVRINKDYLRTMLHFDKFTGKNEGLTISAANALATLFLGRGKNVIIDDTNLNPKTVESWVSLAKNTGAKIDCEVMEATVETCLTRDKLREKKVGQSVIVGMALRYQLYPKPEKGFVICDIDGTIADCAHRRHFLDVPEGQRKDWKGFFDAMSEDTVRVDVLARLVEASKRGHEIIFVSGRPDNYREQTEAWIENVFPSRSTILMRRANDSRPDTEVKQEIYDTFFKDKYPVAYVIDDRPSVIRMWQANGLEVVDVGDGVEF